MSNTFIELATRRRSIRRYQPRPVEQEKIDLLIEAVLRAPSSRGVNPWEFVVVTDPETLTLLSRAKPHGASFLQSAPLAVVVCADPQKTDVWVEDASIAAIYLHLAATDLGLGSCWIQIRLRDHDQNQSASARASEILGLRPGLEVAAIMAVGYALEEKEPHAKATLPYEKVHIHKKND